MNESFKDGGYYSRKILVMNFLKTTIIFLFLSAIGSFFFELISDVFAKSFFFFYGVLSYIVLYFIFYKVIVFFKISEKLLIRVIGYKTLALIIFFLISSFTNTSGWINFYFLNKYKNNILVYKTSYWEDEDGDDRESTEPLVAFSINEVKKNSLLPYDIIIDYNEKKDSYKIVNIEEVEYEDRNQIEFSISDIYPIFKGYSLYNIQIHWTKKWLYGGFIYFFEIVIHNWFIILLSVIFLIIDKKYSNHQLIKWE